jgi:hypothetical protein
MFKELRPEAQKLFWLADAKGQGALCNELATHVGQHREELEEDKQGGDYLPESVYAKMGYNTEAIKNNCAKKWDEELGEWTYKKVVVSEFKAKIKKDVHHEITTLRNDRGLSSRLDEYASPAQKKRKRESSSSSASSSKSSEPASPGAAKRAACASKAAKAKARAQAKAKAAACKKAANFEKIAKAAAEKRAQQEGKQERLEAWVSVRLRACAHVL